MAFFNGRLNVILKQALAEYQVRAQAAIHFRKVVPRVSPWAEG
jgi:hypothetical protein